MSEKFTLNDEYEFLRSRIAEIHKTIDTGERQLKYLMEDFSYLEEELWKVENFKALRTASRRIKKFFKVDPSKQLKKIISKPKN